MVMPFKEFVGCLILGAAAPYIAVLAMIIAACAFMFFLMSVVLYVISSVIDIDDNDNIITDNRPLFIPDIIEWWGRTI